MLSGFGGALQLTPVSCLLCFPFGPQLPPLSLTVFMSSFILSCLPPSSCCCVMMSFLSLSLSCFTSDFNDSIAFSSSPAESLTTLSGLVLACPVALLAFVFAEEVALFCHLRSLGSLCLILNQLHLPCSVELSVSEFRCFSIQIVGSSHQACPLTAP